MENAARKYAALYALTAVLVFFLTFIHSFRTTIILDYGVLIDRSFRLFMGQVPYRDYHGPVTPLTFMTQAAVWKLFSPSVFWMKMYLSFMNTVLVLAAALFCEKFLKTGWNLLAFLLVPILIVWSPGIILMRPWYDFDANFHGFFSLVLLTLATLKGKNWIFAAAGACSALSFLSKQNIGMGSCVASILFIALQPAAIGEKVKRSGVFILGVAIPMAAFAGYLIANDALAKGIEWAWFRASQKSDANYIVQALRCIFQTQYNFVKFLFLLYGGAAFLCWKERRDDPSQGSLRLGIVLYSFLTVWFSMLSHHGNDYPQQQIYLGVLLAILFTHWTASGEPWKHLIRRPGFLSVSLAAGIALLWPVHKYWQIPYRYGSMRYTPSNE